MFGKPQLNRAIRAARENLRAVNRGLKRIARQPITGSTIAVNGLTRASIEKAVIHAPADSVGTDFLYVIQIPQTGADAIPKLIARFKKARLKSKDYSRINSHHKSTRTLYVGRSQKFRQRLRQHLGAGSRGIYSLHLQRWAIRIIRTLEIHYLRFDGEDDLLIQAIEDGIWLSLKPAFGRKGAR